MRRLLPIALPSALASLVILSVLAAPAGPAPGPAPTPTRSGVFLPLVRNPPTLTPTSTATNTPLPTITPIATNTPIPPGVLVLPNHSVFTNSGSYLHIVGEVLNNIGGSAEFVKVSVQVFNGAQLVATDFTYTDMFTLRAGDKTCFEVLVNKPAAWTSYQFEAVQYRPTTDPTPNLALLNVSSTNSGSSYHIIGQVRNDAGVKVTFVEPIGTLYSSNGTVLDCDFTFVNSTDLDPGQTSAFDMLFFSRESYAGVATYRVQVDGNLP